ncbi:unnamed protein product [Natator depressus]
MTAPDKEPGAGGRGVSRSARRTPPGKPPRSPEPEPEPERLLFPVTVRCLWFGSLLGSSESPDMMLLKFQVQCLALDKDIPPAV